MIDHVSLGVRDLTLSQRFYAAVLAPTRLPGAGAAGGNGRLG